MRKLNMKIFIAHIFLLSYFNIFGTEATMHDDMMEKYNIHCTDTASCVKPAINAAIITVKPAFNAIITNLRKKFEFTSMGNFTYGMISTIYNMGKLDSLSSEERLALEEDLRKSECMDGNDTPIDGCELGNMMTENDVRFKLWSRNNKPKNFSESETHQFNGKNPTYFIIHGYMSHGENDWIIKAKDALLQTRHSANVISVDWKPLATLLQAKLIWSYSSAAKSIKTVGERTSKLIQNLIQKKGLQTSNLHLVGHSLGAHAAGLTAKRLKTLDNTLSPVAAITGLDPAGPLFFKMNSTQKLDRNDAEYVQVIHTNGGIDVSVARSVLTNTFGYYPPLGDDDYYPNGGSDMPGCHLKYACDHRRAVDYWIESVNAAHVAAPNDDTVLSRISQPRSKFIARACESWNQAKDGACERCTSKCPIMGYSLQEKREARTQQAQQHVYYLKTNSDPPFAALTGPRAPGQGSLIQISKNLLSIMIILLICY